MPCTRKGCKGTAWNIFSNHQGSEIERIDERGILENDSVAQAHVLRYHEKEVPDNCRIYETIGNEERYWITMGSLIKIRRISGISFETLTNRYKRVRALPTNRELPLLIGIDPKLDQEIESILKKVV